MIRQINIVRLKTRCSILFRIVKGPQTGYLRLFNNSEQSVKCASLRNRMAPDGGVHQLFTVVVRSDIGINGCTDDELPPTDFESEFRRSNTRFRIPLQLFGLGIIDGIQDKEIIERHAATTDIRKKLGIIGVPNRSGNDGTISRFGWKAQNKSIAMFAG